MVLHMDGKNAIISECRAAAGQRNRKITQDRLIAAVGTVLAREGFSAIGVNAIADEAGTDKVLIYRYFGGLPELLAAFAQSCTFWPPAEELIENDIETFRSRSLQQRAATVLKNYVKAIQARPVTVEILAWECVEHNALTRSLSDARAAEARRIWELAGVHPQDHALLAGLTTLFAAAINYLAIRSRVSKAFNSYDITSDTLWQQLTDVMTVVCERTLEPTYPAPRKATKRTA